MLICLICMLKTTQEEAISLTFYPFYSETISFKAVKNIKKMNCASKDLQNDILHTYIPKTFWSVIYRDFQYGRPCRLLKNKANLCNLLLYESNWINLILYWIRISCSSIWNAITRNPPKCRPFWFSRWPPLPWKRGHVKKNSSWFVWCFGENWSINIDFIPQNQCIFNCTWYHIYLYIYIYVSVAHVTQYTHFLSTKNVITCEPFDRFSKKFGAL